MPDIGFTLNMAFNNPQASAFRFEWVIELVAMTSGLAALGIARYMFKREKRMFGLWAATACVQPAYVIWKLAEFTIIFPGTYKAGVKVPALFLGMCSRRRSGPHFQLHSDFFFLLSCFLCFLYGSLQQHTAIAPALHVYSLLYDTVQPLLPRSC